jgi:hypothetical protein
MHAALLSVTSSCQIVVVLKHPPYTHLHEGLHKLGQVAVVGAEQPSILGLRGGSSSSSSGEQQLLVRQEVKLPKAL